MSTLYEIVELANGDIALQREGGAKKTSNGAPLVTMRFSTDLLRFLRGAKMDIAKVMIEAGLERVAHLAESASRESITNEPLTSRQEEAKTTTPASPAITASRRAEGNAVLRHPSTSHTSSNLVKRRIDNVDPDEQHHTVSHLLH